MFKIFNADAFKLSGINFKIILSTSMFKVLILKYLKFRSILNSIPKFLHKRELLSLSRDK